MLLDESMEIVNLNEHKYNLLLEKLNKSFETRKEDDLARGFILLKLYSLDTLDEKIDYLENFLYDQTDHESFKFLEETRKRNEDNEV